jgi:hypothetical protein
MIIAHFKSTPVAFAPEAICEVINKYTSHHAYVFGFNSSRKVMPTTDVVHNHNKLGPRCSGLNLIQYHSEPFRVDWNVSIPKLVIAQWPALFDEYSNSRIVRNPIDLFDEIYLPRFNDKSIVIGYSPSINTRKSLWHDKGYEQTIEILKRIEGRFGKRVSIDVIHGVPLSECLLRKSRCNIFIDEVITESYHRSGLESLGMGVATICSLGGEIEQMLLRASKAETHPFINVRIDQLEDKLIEMVDAGIGHILNLGEMSRNWMINHWHPCVVANEFVYIYEELMGGGHEGSAEIK